MATELVQENTGSSPEHEVWGPGPEAAESARAWDSCVKNPRHEKFIPINEFGAHSLSEEFQNEDFLKFIGIMSVLTVRLRVSLTSPCRPDDGGYYGCDNGGPRVGTGFICNVEPPIECCPCSKCKDKKGNGQRVWPLRINTAMHVVYDRHEATGTCVDLFFDDDQSRHDGRMKTLLGVALGGTNYDLDHGQFFCICHDDELASHLRDQVHLCDELWKKLHRWFVSLKSPPVVIVSHPHGRPKYVTVGEMKEMGGPFMGVPFKYTTDTCPGTSGAFMWLWQNLWCFGEDLAFLKLTHRSGGSHGCNEGICNSFTIR